MVFIGEYAKLCELTYIIPKYPEVASPEGWELIGKYSPEGSFGTFFAIFVNKEAKEVILAIRGTDNWWNQVNDALLAKGRFADERSELFGQHVVEEVGKEIIEGSIFGQCREALKELTNMNIEVTNWFFKLIISIVDKLFGKSFSNPLRHLFAEFEAENGGRLNDTGGYQDRLHDLGTSIAREYPGYELRITGHSLGGCMAILSATKLNVTAITFESCGAVNLMQGLERYKDLANIREINRGKPEIAVDTYNFLSAPNIINTLDKHPGNIFRMKIPHDPKELTETYGRFSQFASAITDSVVNNSWLRHQHQIFFIKEYLMKDFWIHQMDSWPDLKMSREFLKFGTKPIVGAWKLVRRQMGKETWEQQMEKESVSTKGYSENSFSCKATQFRIKPIGIRETLNDIIFSNGDPVAQF